MCDGSQTHPRVGVRAITLPWNNGFFSLVQYLAQPPAKRAGRYWRVLPLGLAAQAPKEKGVSKVMAKMNWGQHKKPGVSYGSKRQLALKLERKEKIPATEKQKAYMKSLGIEFPQQITKGQAMHLISSTLLKLKELDSKMQKEFSQAMDRDKS